LGALHSSLFAKKRQVKKRGREKRTKGERWTTEVVMAVAAAAVVVIGRSLVVFPISLWSISRLVFPWEVLGKG
jgi:hypothetical protein